MSEKFYSKN